MRIERTEVDKSKFMGHLILVRGVAGSGKSFLGKLIVDNPLSADDFWDWDYTTDPRGFDFEELKRAHERCLAATEGQMRRCEPVIVVANTFTKARDMQPYIKLAKSYGFSITTLVVENRFGRESVHNVPAETLDKMRQTLAQEIIL